MRSLFLKIFLWFWLSILAMGAAVIFVQRQWAEPPRLPAASAMEAYAAQAAQLADGGPEALHHWLHELNEDSRLRFAVLDGRGRTVSGRPLPAELARRALEATPEAADRYRLRVQAFNAGGSWLLLVAVRPPPHHWERLPRWLRLLIALAVSALVSLLLAAHLSRPIRAVRQAAQRLAAGQLDSRVPRLRRRDELGGLGRDFNAMAERLQALIESQNRLLRDVSHELRSPLARLQVALELARGKAGTAAGPMLDRIELEGERLNELIGQVLALARMETGAIRPGRERVALGQLLTEVVDDASFEATAHAREVRLELAHEPVISADPALLRSAVENVIRNALRYTAPGTAVEVRLSREPQWAVIAVRDHGPGVAEDQLGRIFEPFARVSEARERASGGYGLGLAIARRAVTLHGGRIQAANAADGGLRVELRLPAAE